MLNIFKKTTLLLLLIFSSVKGDIIPYELEDTIKKNILAIYQEDHLDEIYNKIYAIAYETKRSRPALLYLEDITRKSDWYKDEITYILYPDSFGSADNSGDFYQLIEMLDYLQNLGITMIHIMPFLDSPMKDGGFDVRNPHKVRRSLGGIEAFNRFIKEAHKRGLKIKMDLMLNHLSEEHQWFQSILSGDLTKLEYFIYRKSMPKYEKIISAETGTIIKYLEDDDSTSERRLAFPENNIHHYRHEIIQEQDYYFYHTFNDFELDINWQNPDALYYMLDVISFWSNIGIDVFNLNAVPLLIKKEGTNGKNLAENNALIKIISAFTQVISPKTALQIESCQKLPDISKYFGEETHIEHEISDYTRILDRSSGVQIAYNFSTTSALWLTILEESPHYLWDSQELLEKNSITATSSWSNFLRTHDELTLEIDSPANRKLLYDKLIDKGGDFRQKYGISGRTAEFLDCNPQKIALAHSILLSLPGIPTIYYGDEIGLENKWQHAHRIAYQRKKNSKQEEEEDILKFFDSRDIHRGPVDYKNLYNSQRNNQLFRDIKQMLTVRKSYPALSRGTIKKINPNNNKILAFERALGNQNILIIHNLSDLEQEATLDFHYDSKTTLDIINKKHMKLKTHNQKTIITLPPYRSLWISTHQ